MADKIVDDITNPINMETYEPVVPAEGSSAAELAAALPSSRVLKAFNTNFAPTLSEPKVGPLTTTVLVAGDDADAKSEASPSYVDGLASHHQPGTMPSL